MGRSVFFLFAILINIILIATLAGCGGSSSKPAEFPVPASIILSPSIAVSMDVGGIQSFTATPQNNNKQTISTPISFQSSNTAVLTIAANGSACAGSWDSLSAPQVCTPGQSGVAQVTATARGVSSPPTTVYVHQHIDSIIVNPVTPPTTSCYSKDTVVDYEAHAFSRNAEITSSVGTFTWQVLNSSVVELNTTPIGLPTGQGQFTARTPGMTSIFASASGVTSVPITVTTCAVESITLAVTGSSGNAITTAKGTTKAITATVLDTLGATITGLPLTWCSSEPASVSVGTNCSTNTSGGVTATASQAGGSTVIASCTPPTCNIGFIPTQPIYPEGAVSFAVTGTSVSTTVWVASTGCGTTDGCVSNIVPVTTPANTIGNTIPLPATPNSLLFTRDGSQIFVGTDRGLLGTKGLAIISVSANTVSLFTSATGKVLAVSPDGKKVVLSHTDPAELPNQVFVFDTTNNSSVPLAIAGATAADFSPDGLKAYILAGSTLYVYSPLDALKTIPLSAPANDVSFLANGAFAYLAGGSSSAVTVFRTCDNALAQTVGTPSTPFFIKTTPDATQVLAVDPPSIDVINVTTTPTGCTPSVSNTANSVNLGQGSFVPTQLIVSADGSRAYVLASNLASILVFNIGNQTSSAIALAANATPIQASLTIDGTLLYVTASDGLVHVIDTVAGDDAQQISFPQNFCGGGVTFTCKPDLIAVKP
jgi:trimeric autotransporter adhesin